MLWLPLVEIPNTPLERWENVLMVAHQKVFWHFIPDGRNRVIFASVSKLWPQPTLSVLCQVSFITLWIKLHKFYKLKKGSVSWCCERAAGSNGANALLWSGSEAIWWADRDMKHRAAGAVLITLLSVLWCWWLREWRGVCRWRHNMKRRQERRKCKWGIAIYWMETAESGQVVVRSPDRCAVDEVCCRGGSWRDIYFDTVY